MCKTGNAIGRAGVIAFAFSLLMCSDPKMAQQPRWWDFEWSALYTRVIFKAKGDSATVAQAQSRVDSLFRRQTLALQYGGALDSSLRYAHAGDTVAVDTDVCGLMRYGEEKFFATQGRFHPGIGDLLFAYGLVWGGTPHVPTGDTLLSMRRYLADSLFFTMIPGTCKARIRSAGHRMTLGAVAEGWALDHAAAILDGLGLRDWYLESGGDIQVRGRNPHDQSWTIGVQDPDRHEGVLGVVHVDSGVPVCFSTAGGYEKFFVDANGVRHHHLLDPSTAESSRGMKGVTAFATNSLEADFWDTYLFLLPFDSSRKVVEATPGLEAVLVSDDSVYVSTGLRGVFQVGP